MSKTIEVYTSPRPKIETTAKPPIRYWKLLGCPGCGPKKCCRRHGIVEEEANNVNR